MRDEDKGSNEGHESAENDYVIYIPDNDLRCVERALRDMELVQEELRTVTGKLDLPDG